MRKMRFRLLIFICIVTEIVINVSSRHVEKMYEKTSGDNGDENMKVTASSETYDYAGAVDDILFVEEFIGIGRIIASCEIRGGDNSLRYRAKISEMACRQACSGGKDPNRQCAWNTQVIKTNGRYRLGSCIIKGGDDRTRYRAKISEAACRKSCAGGKDPNRGCMWGTKVIKAPIKKTGESFAKSIEFTICLPKRCHR